MKVIYNKFIPFKGFKAINLFGIIFARKECKMLKKDLNHEAIHTTQMKELWYIPFYIMYVFNWLLNLVKFKDSMEAYRNICFEREAYNNEYKYTYLNKRPKFNFKAYV